MESLPLDLAQNIYHRACLLDIKGRSKNLTFRFTFGKDKNFRYEFRRIDTLFDKDNIVWNLLNMYELAEKDFAKFIEDVTLRRGWTNDYEERYTENYNEHEHLLTPCMEIIADFDRVIHKQDLDYMEHYDGSGDNALRRTSYYTSILLTQHLRDYFDLDYLKLFYAKRDNTMFDEDPWDDVMDSDMEYDFFNPVVSV